MNKSFWDSAQKPVYGCALYSCDKNVSAGFLRIITGIQHRTLNGELTRMHSNSTGERKSKRARKGRGVLNVSSSNTLKELRMNIAQSLGVHPLNAVIHARKNGLWQAIEGEDLTLRGMPHRSPVLCIFV